MRPAAENPPAGSSAVIPPATALVQATPWTQTRPETIRNEGLAPPAIEAEVMRPYHMEIEAEQVLVEPDVFQNGQILIALPGERAGVDSESQNVSPTRAEQEAVIPTSEGIGASARDDIPDHQGLTRSQGGHPEEHPNSDDPDPKSGEHQELQK